MRTPRCDALLACSAASSVPSARLQERGEVPWGLCTVCRVASIIAIQAFVASGNEAAWRLNSVLHMSDLSMRAQPPVAAVYARTCMRLGPISALYKSLNPQCFSFLLFSTHDHSRNIAFACLRPLYFLLGNLLDIFAMLLVHSGLPCPLSLSQQTLASALAMPAAELETEHSHAQLPCPSRDAHQSESEGIFIPRIHASDVFVACTALHSIYQQRTLFNSSNHASCSVHCRSSIPFGARSSSCHLIWTQETATLARLSQTDTPRPRCKDQIWSL